MRSYKIIVGSAVEAFHNSRAKIRLYGGGFCQWQDNSTGGRDATRGYGLPWLHYATWPCYFS